MLTMSFIKKSGTSIPTSFSRVASATNAELTSGTLTMPADILAGDVLFLGQACNYRSGGGTPTGWTFIDSATGGTSGRIQMDWKIADGSESGAILSGLYTTSNNLTFSGINKTIIVFRANRAIENTTQTFFNARWGGALEQFDYGGLPSTCLNVSYSWNRVSNAFGTSTGINFGLYAASSGRNTAYAMENHQPSVRGCMSWRFDLTGGGVDNFNMAGSTTNSPICGNAYCLILFT